MIKYAKNTAKDVSHLTKEQLLDQAFLCLLKLLVMIVVLLVCY